MALQFRRGLDSDRGTITPAAGEPIFTTDNNELYIGDGSTAGGINIITSKVDSAYVQARQTTYTTANFADSAFVTTQINNLIDGAPGTLNTLNEIAAALNDDDSAYSTLIGLINAKSDLDSTDAIALIDSAYVQARQSAAGEIFKTISVSGQSDVVADGTSDTLTLVAGDNMTITTDAGTDTVTFATSAGTDSAATQAMIDSSISFQFLIDSDLSTADSAQLVHSFTATDYRTIKYVAQLTASSSYHAEEILLTHNGTTVAMTTYAKVLLDSDLGTFDAVIESGTVKLNLSPSYTNTNVKLRGTRISS